MTGPEIVSAAALAKKAAESALVESPSTKERLLDLASGTPELERAAKHLARRIEIKQAIITAFYKPLARFADSGREYFKEDGQFQHELSEKVADVPAEELVEPPPSVAVPAMQGLSYSLTEPDLKDMYLNLLATATDGRISDAAHPGFADVIRQLSPAEAPELRDLLQHPGRSPICELRWTTEDFRYHVAARHVMDYVDGDPPAPKEEPRLAMWVDNWARLGLVTVDYINRITDDGAYDWVDSRPEFLGMQKGSPYQDPRDPDKAYRPTYERGHIGATAFGQSFAAAVFAAAPTPPPS